MLTLRIDPWATSYESAFQLEDEQPPADVAVDPFVETEDWRPIGPAYIPQPESTVFVDGVQRVDLRVLGEEDGRLVYGAFASVAVGAVIARPGQSAVQPQLARRVIALGSGVSCGDWKVPCGSAELLFQCEAVPDSGVDGWRKAVDQVRRQSETKLGLAMTETHPLVIVDGRLTFQPTRRSHAVGVAKSIRTQYLQPPHSDVLGELRPGTRTPVFSISYDHPVYSWYVRLTEPRQFEHRWAGIVQVETLAAIGREQAIGLADLTAQHLPSFASSAAWDPRAPQNLYPVSALEERLRHEMGDPEWVRRHLEAHFHRNGGVS